MLNIKEFYKGKTILLTGCTGFLGKVILEKLLRSCPDIKKIYIMSRAKRNMEPLERLKQQILASECFNTLVKIHGSQEQFFEFA
jgi:fatty acyl-CoA reductase